MWSAKYLFRLLCSSSAVRCKFGSLSASPVQRLEKTNGEEQDSPRKRGPMEKNKSRNTARYWGSMENRHYLRCPIRHNHPWLSPPCYLIHLIQYITVYSEYTQSASRNRPTCGLPQTTHKPLLSKFFDSFQYNDPFLTEMSMYLIHCDQLYFHAIYYLFWNEVLTIHS